MIPLPGGPPGNHSMVVGVAKKPEICSYKAFSQTISDTYLPPTPQNKQFTMERELHRIKY